MHNNRSQAGLLGVPLPITGYIRCAFVHPQTIHGTGVVSYIRVIHEVNVYTVTLPHMDGLGPHLKICWVVLLRIVRSGAEPRRTRHARPWVLRMVPHLEAANGVGVPGSGEVIGPAEGEKRLE